MSLTNELVRYAVQRAIFCPFSGCGKVLDARTATLFDQGARSCPACPECAARVGPSLPEGVQALRWEGPCP